MTSLVARFRRARAWGTPLAPELPTSRPPKPMRRVLAGLVVVCLMPGALISTALIVADYRQSHARAARDVLVVARAAAASLDRDLASIESGLKVLATSDELISDDLRAFEVQARLALPHQNITNYVLLDADHQQRLNTLRSFGTPLPSSGGPAELRRVFTEGRPWVTDLFTGPVTGRPILAVGVPVTRQGKVVYSLNAGIVPDRMAGVLTSQALGEGWIAAILDRQGRIVARNKDMAQWVGQLAVPDLVRAVKTPEQREGVIYTETLEGIPVITAFARSSVSGWSVAVGTPQATLTEGLVRSLLGLLATMGLLFAAALGVAWHLALSRVARPTQRLLSDMERLARGEPPSNAPMPHASQEVQALAQGLVTLSEQLRQRESDRTAMLAAEAANAAKTDFLSRMSHELRTPLNAVLGFSQLLRMDPRYRLTAEQGTLVMRIESAGQHLLDMINDVLDVSRIESGQLKVGREAVLLRPLVHNCEAMVDEHLQRSGLRMQVDWPAGPEHLAVWADPVRLRQVLLNLLSNAIKYNSPGGQVGLRITLQDAQVSLAVHDRGPGLTPEQQAQLFQPFNRLGQERSGTPGTGIGLVITRHLVQMMGGTLAVDSQPGQGSTFTVVLAQAPTPAL